MVEKLAAIIVTVGATFGALLVNRQQRIDVAAEISRTALRMELHAQTVSRLQAAVASAIRPSELHIAAGRLPVEWQAIRYRFEPFGTPAPCTSAAQAEDRDSLAARWPRDRLGG